MTESEWSVSFKQNRLPGGGQPLSEFLEDSPTVPKEQAVAALEQAKADLLASVRPA